MEVLKGVAMEQHMSAESDRGAKTSSKGVRRSIYLGKRLSEQLHLLGRGVANRDLDR